MTLLAKCRSLSVALFFSVALTSRWASMVAPTAWSTSERLMGPSRRHSPAFLLIAGIHDWLGPADSLGHFVGRSSSLMAWRKDVVWMSYLISSTGTGLCVEGDGLGKIQDYLDPLGIVNRYDYSSHPFLGETQLLAPTQRKTVTWTSACILPTAAFPPQSSSNPTTKLCTWWSLQEAAYSMTFPYDYCKRQTWEKTSSASKLEEIPWFQAIYLCL